MIPQLLWPIGKLKPIGASRNATYAPSGKGKEDEEEKESVFVMLELVRQSGKTHLLGCYCRRDLEMWQTLINQARSTTQLIGRGLACALTMMNSHANGMVVSCYFWVGPDKIVTTSIVRY